jgi:hypothetical protein
LEKLEELLQGRRQFPAPAVDDSPVFQIRVAVEISLTCHLPEYERSWPRGILFAFMQIVLLKSLGSFFNSVALGHVKKT